MQSPSAAIRTERPAFGLLVRTTLKRVWLPGLAVPLLICALLAWITVQQIVDFEKGISERVGVGVAGLALLIAGVRALASREPYFIWLSALALNFLTREIHFAGTSTTVYLGFLALVWAAWYFYPSLAPYLQARRVVTLLACTVFTYFVAMTLDARWWRFIPYESVFEARVEEVMEIVGHAFIVLLAIFSSPVRAPVSDS